MLIDWFTVIAQIVNFLILVWLMKRFLYTPILDAIDAREQLIAASLADAMAKQGEAQRQCDEYKEKNEEFERQRKALLGAAMLEAQAERQKLFEDARKVQEEIRRRRQEAMQHDFQNQKEEIVRQTRKEVFAIARKTLADLAAESLEKQMVQTFVRRCRALGDEEKRALIKAFDASVGPAVVRSTFPLPELQQRNLEHSIRQTFAFAGQFQFKASPDLISGIALSVNGYEVAWSIADYLLALERSVDELLSAQSSAKVPNDANSGKTGTGGPFNPKLEYGTDDHG